LVFFYSGNKSNKGWENLSDFCTQSEAKIKRMEKYQQLLTGNQVETIMKNLYLIIIILAIVANTLAQNEDDDEEEVAVQSKRGLNRRPRMIIKGNSTHVFKNRNWPGRFPRKHNP